MTQAEALWGIPKNWAWTVISALGEVVAGGTPSSKEPKYWGGNINWISPADLTGYTKKTISKGKKSITEEGLKNSSAKVMPAGSVHFSSRAPVGYVVISAKPIATNQGFKSLVPEQGIFNEYVYFYLKASKQLAEKRASGTTFLELSGKAFGLLPIPLPPLNEQKRIVAKIEELFSELDNGIAALKTAREQLKVYRQAVLKHAFEGNLTEKWREENKDKLESPEQLLARIQQEREARYQQQLEEWKTAVLAWEANGKEGKKPGKPKEFTKQGEIGAGSEIGFDIPETWKSMLMGHVFSVHVGATPSRKKNEFWNGDIFWVSSGEVAFCEIYKTVETITTEGYENASTEIHQDGTVLLAMIGEGKTRGQAAILRVPAAHNQNTAAIRVSEVGLPPEYIYYFFQYQYEQTRRVGSGNNQKALNKNRVASIQFPLCSVEEQMAVVQALSEKLSFVENLDNELNVQLAKAETLRQSILKKAFSGQLVPQDPHDAPASELLARIKAEKAAESAKNKKKKPAVKRGRKQKESAVNG